MKLLTIAQAAYIAGLVDGEGHIGLAKMKSKQRGMASTYSPRVDVANTKHALLLWCKLTTGIGEVKVSGQRSNRTDYSWELKIDEMTQFLMVIRSYLVIKREQADLVIEYLERCRGIKNHKPSEEIMILRSVIFDELTELNRKGDA